MNKFKVAFLLALLSVGAVAQDFISTLPSGGKKFEVKQILGTQSISSVGSRICSGHSVVVVKASATTLTAFSGAAVATPQYVLWPTLSASVTAETTLTMTGATGKSGTVFLWAKSVGTTVTYYVGSSMTGVSIACSGSGPSCPTASVVSAFPVQVGVVPIWAWSVVNGVFEDTNLASGDAGTSKDCWVDVLTLANVSAIAVAVTVQDGLGSVIVPTIALPGNSVSQIPLYGGRMFNGGLFWNAGTASAVHGYARFIRIAGPSSAP